MRWWVRASGGHFMPKANMSSSSQRSHSMGWEFRQRKLDTTLESWGERVMGTRLGPICMDWKQIDNIHT